MKSYKVVVTINAQEDIKRYLRYIRNVKKNPQAAKSILDDYIATRMHLSTCAAMLADPDSEILKQRKLKRMNFLKHDYFILYMIEDDKAVITNIFHSLEDHESKLK